MTRDRKPRVRWVLPGGRYDPVVGDGVRWRDYERAADPPDPGPPDPTPLAPRPPASGRPAGEQRSGEERRASAAAPRSAAPSAVMPTGAMPTGATTAGVTTAGVTTARHRSPAADAAGGVAPGHVSALTSMPTSAPGSAPPDSGPAAVRVGGGLLPTPPDPVPDGRPSARPADAPSEGRPGVPAAPGEAASAPPGPLDVTAPPPAAAPAPVVEERGDDSTLGGQAGWIMPARGEAPGWAGWAVRAGGAAGRRARTADWFDGPARPPRLADCRPYGMAGGLARPDPQVEHDLRRAVPPGTRFPDPRGTWVRLINGGGPADDPFRASNAADCALAVLSTWHGEPAAAAARHPEYDRLGRPVLSGETGGAARIERWVGQRFQYAGHGRHAYPLVERRLIEAGHGAAAVIVVRWPGGGSHAWNAVNFGGEVIWIDAQRGHMAVDPPYTTVTGVFCVVVDRYGRPR